MVKNDSREMNFNQSLQLRTKIEQISLKISLKPIAGFLLTIDIQHFSKITLLTRVNLYKVFKVSNCGQLVYVRSIQNGYSEPSAWPWMILSNVDAFKNSNPSENHSGLFLEFLEIREILKV